MKSYLKKAMCLLLSAAVLASASVPAFADSSEVTKDENVYILLHSDGSVKSQTVSDWLHCDSGLAGVTDPTTLSDVVNLKSDETPAVENGALMWNTEDTDVYYQGTTEQTPPVTVSIRYELDGKEMPAEEMLGQAGHVKITLSLVNHEKHPQEIGGTVRNVFTPFITMVAADLPREHFWNVNIPHGSIQTDSQNQMACAVALPGMQETFDGLLTGKMSSLKDYFLDEIVVEADTDSFVMPSILLAAATSMEELEKQVDFPDLDGTLRELKSGTAQLDDGARQLAEATETLRGKMNEFAAQYNTFDAGVDAAYAGSKEVKGGAQQLSEGAQNLTTGLAALKNGAAQLDAGTNALKSQLDQSLLPGLTAAGTLQQKLNEEMQNAQQALNGVPETSDLQAAVGAVTQALNGAAADAGAAAQNAVTGAASNAAGSVKEQCKAAVQAAMDADGTLTPEQQTAILAALDSVGGYDASQDAAAANGAVQQAVGAQAQTVQQVLAPLAGLDTTALKGSFGTVSTDAATLLTMMNEMTGKLYNEQDNSATLYGGAVQLKEGTDQLLGGMEQIGAGADALAAGAAKLDGGAASLQSGLEQLSSSSKVVKDAIAQFQSGSSQLAGGASTLQSGMSEFRSKTDSAASQLDAAQLDQISQIAQALEEQANAYTSYTGAAENVRASVKFVMKVEGPEQTGTQQEQSSGQSVQDTTFWDRVKNLFQ